MTTHAEGVKELLAGRRDLVEKLATGHQAWVPLVEAVVEEPSPAPALVSTLWTVLPNVEEWVGRLDEALDASDRVVSRLSARRKLIAWLRDSVLAAFPPSHEAAIQVQIQDLRRVSRGDGGFREAQQLYARLVEQGAPAARLGQVALLVTQGAFTVRDYAAARRHAERAMESFRAAKDETGRDLAERYLAGALLHARDWSAALSILDRVLREPGFGFNGLSVSIPFSEPVERAIAEAQQVALWASETAPEWVRALGALAEVLADEPVHPEFQRRFEAALARLAESDDAQENLEIVVRQLRERSFQRAAAVAASQKPGRTV